MRVMLTERPLCRRDRVLVWSAHAAGNPKESDRNAEQAVAADRFAREIVRFLTGSPAARSRRLNFSVRRQSSNLCHITMQSVLQLTVG
jgi:hypothetical protein